MQIKFTIPGNPDFVNGEPEPHKQIYGQYARECFYAQYKVQKTSVVMVDDLADALMNNKGFPLRPANGNLKPIDIKRFSVSVKMDIFWAENPGNNAVTFFTVLNALVNDFKTLKSGEFQSHMSQDKRGRVDVTIRIE